MEEVLLSLATEDASLAPDIIERRFKVGEHLATTVIDRIVRWGLALPAEGADPPLLLTAGKQYLQRRGAVPEDTLLFLSRWIDDLDARDALRQGTHALVGELHAAFTNGDPVDVARTMVPPAFEAAVDRALAARLYAAAAALAARLGEGAPPACVAEEVLLVWVLDYAEGILRESELSDERIEKACSALHDVFELCQDSDVLLMFEMTDPADAAVAEETSVYGVMGVADQRIGAWFQPFGYSVPTGHLDEPDQNPPRG